MSGSGLSWQQLHIILPGGSVAAASDLLEHLGALSITTVQADGRDHFDLAAPQLKPWEQTELCALFDPNTELGTAMDALGTAFPDQADSIRLETVADRDWERAWLERFKPLRVGDNLWVCPSWCEPPEPNARNLILDPGLAFGTGTHATTALCLDALSRMDLENAVVVDYGCGSGILAIAAALCGARRVVANDIDPLALSATRENAKVNGVDDRIIVTEETSTAQCLARSADRADLVIANILADALVELHDRITALLKPDGRLLLSGILGHQADQVRTAYRERDFDVFSHDDWRLLMSR